MRLHFDPDFDGGCWPGPSEAAGESWVGPTGLLGVLETQLGLRGPATSPLERVARLLPTLRKTDGFWSRSAESDPLGTARRLVAWHDALSLAGWNRTGGTPTLEALADVTAALAPGVPARLRAVRQRLDHARCDVEALHTFTPLDALPTLWRSVLGILEQTGTNIGFLPLPLVEAEGDLAASRLERFEPKGDGSLQLVRAHGVLQAADGLAAWLSTLSEDERRQTVVIGADAVLDRALRARGLPTLGGMGRIRESPLLQILPLALAVAWGPPDPQRALELLTLPDTPVPAVIRFRLAHALHETPAVDSDAWRAALTEGLAQLDSDSRPAAAARVDLLFHRAERSRHLSAEQIRERIGMLRQWALGRAAHVEEDTLRRWGDLLHQLSTFESLLDTSELAQLSAPQLERFAQEATASTPLEPPFPHQVGFGAVGSPGAICGPCDRVVWWNFELHTVAQPERLPLSRADLDALAQSGVRLPSPSEAMVDLARRWVRPHRLARKAQVWCCPQFGEDGEPAFPHPLFDEVLSRIPPEAQRAAETHLVRPAPLSSRPPKVSRPSLLPAPVPQRDWQVTAPKLQRRETESPAGAASLLGCSLQWALQYVAKLRSGALGNLGTAEQVIGDTTHALLATLLQSGEALSPDEAESRAQMLFDTEGPRYAAQLFQPGSDAQRAEVRSITGLAARELFRMISEGRFEVCSVEEPSQGKLLGGEFEGRPDLVLKRGKTRAVVDLKWSGAKYRRESLEIGTAHQLAAYSRLLGGSGQSLPANAFFILRGQRLLTTDEKTFPGAWRVEGPTPEETWRAFEKAHAERWKEVRSGALTATGVALDPNEAETSGIVDGKMRLQPPCHFCGFSEICGQAFAGGES